MSEADWRALIEQFLADEIDAVVFRDDFLEAWQGCIDDQETVPRQIEDLHSAVDAFEPGTSESDDLQADARRALELLNSQSR